MPAPAPQESHAPGLLLEARGIVKTFSGVTALRGVSFDLRSGEIHALCGENGAGKSTLIKTLSGLYPHGSYEGELRIDRQPARFAGIRDAERAGLAVIYQELALVDELSVAENLFLGSEPRRGWRIDWETLFARARELLGRFGIALDPETPVRALGVGQKQLVEIARALGKNARILILDEPTAALAEAETTILLGLLRELRARGVGCIYISHRLDEVKALADRVTVLRDGAAVLTAGAAEAGIPEIIRAMVGREIADLFPRRAPAAFGETRLEARGLSAAAERGGPARLRDLSFSVRAGEVLGIGGLMGAGRTELLMHLFGAWGERLSGEVRLQGKPYPAPAPRESLRRGLALVGEDRKRHGLHLRESVGYNLSLSSLSHYTRRGVLDAESEARAGAEQAKALQVAAPGLETIVGGLSGGNQQKVVLGKALLAGPSVVLLDEPTRGIDVGAKLKVYELINRLTDEGRAVVLVSSELPELMGMSDRILMLHEGAMGGEFSRRDFSQERLLAAAMGRTAPHAA